MKTNKRQAGLRGILRRIGALLQRSNGTEDERARRTRLVYILLSVGTVAISYLLVLLNYGVFSLSERTLYGKPVYDDVTIASAGTIADPLSRVMRVELYQSCTRQGDERAALPEERTKADALAQVKTLWEETLNLYAEANNGSLKTGESVDRVLRGSRYTAHLRDFYNEQNETKIAVWSAQAYYTAADGRVYCLSAELDSRVEDVYSVTVALFDSIDGVNRASDFYPMLDALGEPRSRAQGMTTGAENDELVSTVSLSDGIVLVLRTQKGVQSYLTLALSDESQP
ncbi:MAG: hypothetical protein IJP98_03955 [Clostridia bacterium]|nr:hypothetical protein [Clostridia bacterium]